MPKKFVGQARRSCQRATVAVPRPIRKRPP